MLKRLGFIPALVLATVLGCMAIVARPALAASESAAQSEQFKVVYHINDATEQAMRALRSIRNHLDVAPNTQIAVVAHGDGIDFLMTDYEDAETASALVAGLAARGVTFEVCEITMERQGLTHDDFVLEAEFTPSGVVRLVQLQAAEGYAYIRP